MSQLGTGPVGMQNHQSSEIGSGGVVYCFHDRLLLLESVLVSILKGVYCLFFSRSTMSGNSPSDEVGKPYTHPVGKRLPKQEEYSIGISGFYALGAIGTTVGINAAFWHVSWIAGVLFLGSTVIAIAGFFVTTILHAIE